MFSHTAYGALQDIPGNIDILIAGSSCVDFSNLNVKKKTVKDGGESGDTFLGIMGYARKFKPKVILLENVQGNKKQWNDLKDYMYKSGYANCKVDVDSKDYYVPQTRNRGYMVAILDAKINMDDEALNERAGVVANETSPDHSENDASDLDAEVKSKKKQKQPKKKGQGTEGVHPNDIEPWSKARQVAEEWAETMARFQRSASSPFEDFLLEDDDERVVNCRKEVERTSKHRKTEADWTRNKARHRVYRADLGLGQGRFYTQWEERGVVKGPDFFWRGWMAVQPRRVWDTMDTAYNRAARRGYDFNFKR